MKLLALLTVGLLFSTGVASNVTEPIVSDDAASVLTVIVPDIKVGVGAN